MEDIRYADAESTFARARQPRSLEARSFSVAAARRPLPGEQSPKTDVAVSSTLGGREEGEGGTEGVREGGRKGGREGGREGVRSLWNRISA